MSGVEASRRIATYNEFISRVEELGLSDIGDAKPVLNVSTIGYLHNCGSYTNGILPTACRGKKLSAFSQRNQVHGLAMFYLRLSNGS